MRIINHNTTKVTWLARVLSICFALFVSIFALDVFEENLEFWDKALAFLVHLTPTYLVLLVLFIAWYKELLGAIIYSILGILYIIIAWGRFDWTAYLFISGPLFCIGTLFFISWKQNRRKKLN
ncbi:DUF7670 domain-containing protein [Flavobacterium sp. RSB2_4_14]|uniref:DUF7670 domain-containing protein n=1 Tax=Flavobacterium sp. RSB2_4_14 TaxID=3447665 RepID=UPI003F2F66DE